MVVEFECASTKEYLVIFIEHSPNVKHCTKNLTITLRAKYDYQHIKGEKLKLMEVNEYPASD